MEDLKAEVRIQIKIKGTSSNLIELARSKSELISAGILAIAMNDDVAPFFFKNMAEVREILDKSGHLKKYGDKLEVKVAPNDKTDADESMGAKKSEPIPEPISENRKSEIVVKEHF